VVVQVENRPGVRFISWCCHTPIILQLVPSCQQYTNTKGKRRASGRQGTIPLPAKAGSLLVRTYDPAQSSYSRDYRATSINTF
jgi:hypothetical protein